MESMHNCCFPNTLRSRSARSAAQEEQFAYHTDMDTFELGYAMGLLVGEGCFTSWRNRYREIPVCAVKLHSRDPNPLLALQRVLGGRINGPYCHSNRHYLVWSLRGSALRRAVPTLFWHLPESHKRQQFLEWLTRHEVHLLYPRRPNRPAAVVER
jgi:hypothetical protein